MKALVLAGESGTAPIRAAADSGRAFGLDITYARQPEPLELAQAVLIARDYLGTDDVVISLGDNSIADGITDLIDEFISGRPDAQIMLTRVSDPRQFGVVELDAAGEVLGTGS